MTLLKFVEVVVSLMFAAKSLSGIPCHDVARLLTGFAYLQKFIQFYFA